MPTYSDETGLGPFVGSVFPPLARTRVHLAMPRARLCLRLRSVCTAWVRRRLSTRAHRPALVHLCLAAALSASLAVAAEESDATSQSDATAQSDASSQSHTPVQPDGPSVPYTVVVDTGGDEELANFLLEVSEAHQLESRPPPSIISLRRRGDADRAALERALRSRGYYGAEIDFAIDEALSPIALVFQVTPGKRYELDDVSIEVTPPDSPFVPPKAADIGLLPGQAADAADILAAEQRLLDVAKKASYALARLGERSAVVDHSRQTMNLVLRLDSGPPSLFGDVTFVGVESIDREYLETLIPWQVGMPFDPGLLAEARQNLVDTDLFSSTRLELASELDAQGQLPVTARLAERKQRSIRAGVGYNVDQGIGVRGTWTHRNLFGSGERLLVEGTWSGIGPRLLANLRKPNFYRSDQALIVETSFADLDTDAYRSKSATASVALERTLAPGMTFLIGPAFRYSDVKGTDEPDSETFTLISLGAKLDWDFSDDFLDPARGGRLFVQGGPFTDIQSKDLTFGKILTRYSHYFTVKEEPRLVLAGRLAIGSIAGATRDRIPADLRFYAGGGGSVRGYGFQLASPLDDSDNPIGGNSLLEAAAEVRWQAYGNFGVVAFLDAGRAFEDSVPHDVGDLRFGTGVGLRYATPIGPLRFDVAVPIDRRRGIDDSYQIYISIGQAF